MGCSTVSGSLFMHANVSVRDAVTEQEPMELHNNIYPLQLAWHLNNEQWHEFHALLVEIPRKYGR